MVGERGGWGVVSYFFSLLTLERAWMAARPSAKIYTVYSRFYTLTDDDAGPLHMHTSDMKPVCSLLLVVSATSYNFRHFAHNLLCWSCGQIRSPLSL